MSLMSRYLLTCLMLACLQVPLATLTMAQEESSETVRQRLQDHRALLAETTAHLKNGQAALRSFDAFTKALSHALNVHGDIRQNCAQAYEDYQATPDQLKAFKKTTKKIWQACLRSKNGLNGALTRARRLLPEIEKKVKYIKKQVELSKTGVDRIRSNENADAAALDLSSKLQTTTKGIKNAINAGGS